MWRIKINVKNTKVMAISRNGGGVVKIVLNGERLEQVAKCCYLGAGIIEDGRRDAKIRSRIALAKAAFNNRQELLTNSMSRSVKKKIVETVVWSVLLCGSESWTMNCLVIQRIEAFEMWVLRRIKKVSWKEKKINEEVLTMKGEKRLLIEKIIKTKK